MAVLEIDARQLADVKNTLGRLRDSVSHKVRARAANKAAAELKTATARLAKRDLPALKISTIKRRLTINKASAGEATPTAALNAKGRPLLLTRFGPRHTSPGVVAKTIGGARELYPHAFIATSTRTGMRFVFRRKGKSSYPLEVLEGPSIAVVLQPKINEVLSVGGTLLDKNLVHEIEFELSRLA